MKKRIATALGSDSIGKILSKKGYDVLPDAPYQDAVFEIIKKEFIDVLIVFSELDGDLDKYIFLEKIKSFDKKIKIIVILRENDERYKSFLYSKEIFAVFIDGFNSVESLERCINESTQKSTKNGLEDENILKVDSNRQKDRNASKINLTLKFQKQQIIVFAGIGSCGKSTLAIQTAKILASKAKVLLIDFDTINAGINVFLGIKREPENPGYILPADKNSSLNYMIDAIDKRNFNTNIFEKCIVKSKKIPNFDILTGNNSLYVSKNILNFEYYTRILENAKLLYDYIIIDTSANIFLDSMQFAIINATKVFIVTEGNYLAIERTHRLISELFPIWGVHNKKTEVIINKYNSKSLDKTIIKEMIKEVAIAGYISFSSKYEEMINCMKSKMNLELEMEYYNILKRLDSFEVNSYLKGKSMLKQGISQVKKCFNAKVFSRMEEK